MVSIRLSLRQPTFTQGFKARASPEKGRIKHQFCRRFMWLAVAFGLHELLGIPKGKDAYEKGSGASGGETSAGLPCH